MSTPNSNKLATANLAANAVTRKPRQGRSRASFERMLSATRQLMLERGSEDFTLQDVSERGNVSIGSIYLRFEGKDNLVHAVIAEELTSILEDEAAMIERVCSSSSSLAEFIPLYVEEYAKLLAYHAPLLRLIMQRASYDKAVSLPGKQTARMTAEASVAAILRYRNEMAAKDPEPKAKAAFQIIFSTIARQLSLGSTPESADEDELGYLKFDDLKVELAEMCIAYLRNSGRN